MSLRHIFLFFIVCLLFWSSPAQAQPVSVSPNVYTLGELAEKLSTPDAPVKAAPGAARRLGFACLKERPQAEALRLIGMAFALKASPRPAPEKGFLLVEDPDAARRERRWMNRFVALLQNQVTEAGNDLSALVSLSPEQLVRERDKRYRAQEAMIGKTKPNTPGGQVFTALYNRYMRALIAANHQERLTERLGYLGKTQNLPALVDQAVRNTFYLRSDAFAVGDEATNGNAAHAAGYAVTYAVFERNRDHYNLKIHLDALYPDHKDVYNLPEMYGSSLVDLLFGSVTPDTPDSVAPALGKDAAVWIASERAITEKFLATEPAWKEFKLNPALPSDAMSSRVWQWCAALDREAVVEVFPAMDASEARADSLAHIFQRYDYWSGRNENGVAIITNRLAFLDRARSWNFSALQYLIQAQVKSAGTGGLKTPGIPVANSDGFPVSLLAPFTERAWESGKYTSWNWPGIATSRDYAYYHYTPETLDGAAAIGLLWAQISEEQRNPTKRTEIPLGTFSAATLRLLSQWFQSTGTVTAGHPGFLAYLRQSGRLVLEPGQNKQIFKAAVVFVDPKAPLHPVRLPNLVLTLER